MPYLGNEPAVAYTSTTKDTFSGDGSTTDFTMSKAANVNAVRVVVENVVQNPTVAYTCSGTTLSFTSAPPTGTNNIYVVHLGPPAATVAPPTTINNATTFTGGVTLKNETAEDTDGGRESIVTFQGTQSGNEITTLAQIQASHDGTSDDEKGDLIFKTNDGSDGSSPTEAMRITSGQRLGLGENDPDTNFHIDATSSGNFTEAMRISNTGGGANEGNYIQWEVANTSGYGPRIGGRREGTGGVGLHFYVGEISGAPTEKMRLNHDGSFLVGRTTSSSSSAGFKVETEGDTYITAEGGDGRALYLNRLSSNGTVLEVAQADVTVGNIMGYGASTEMSIGSPHANGSGIYFSSGDQTLPMRANSLSDDTQDLGKSNFRWDDIYATNGTIQTSDENEKQNIASLTSAEITAATAISKLFKTFKWKDKVSAKGDNARTHTGVIAQQVETAMSDAGLDASKYAFWCSNTWWEKEVEVAAVEANEEKLIKAQDAYTRIDTYDTKDEAPEGATERTRMGVRYPELLAFIGAATEQRLTSIESRLDALEAE